MVSKLDLLQHLVSALGALKNTCSPECLDGLTPVSTKESFLVWAIRECQWKGICAENTQAKARISLGDDKQNLEHTIWGWATASSSGNTLLYDRDLSLGAA